MPMQHLLLSLITGVIYYLSALLSVQVLTLDLKIPIAWLPNAILLSALLLNAPKNWVYHLVAVIAAELAASLPSFSLLTASLYAVVNIAECLLIWHIINRYIQFESLYRWNHPPRILAFLVTVLFFATPLAALGGAAVNRYIVGLDKSFFDLWRLWWLGDACGLLVLTPICLNIIQSVQGLTRSLSRVKAHIYVVSVGAISLVVWIAFFSLSTSDEQIFAFTPLLILLPVLWEMLKINGQQKVMIACVIALATAVMTVMHSGPFYQENTQQAVLFTQEFILFFISIIYLISAYYTQAFERTVDLKLLKSAFESAREGIVITEAENDQKIVFCNPAFEALSGYPANELIGQNCRFLNRNHRDQANLTRVREAVRNKVPVEAMLLNTNKQGVDFWNNLSITPIHSGRGSVTHFAGVQQDVTDKVTTSRILEEQVSERTKAFIDSQQRLAMASSVSGLGIWEWDLKTNELVWDDHMHVIYETPEEVKTSGMYYDFWLKSVHPEDVDQASGSLNEAIQARRTWDTEYRLKLPDGKVKHIKANATLKLNDQGEPEKVIGGNIDITKQRVLETQLKKSVDAAKKANQAKSEFLANMSHEIRTPMNGVLGMTELIKNTPLNARQKEYLGMIESSAKSLLLLLNDILDLSKIEAGQLSLDPSPTYLDESVGDVMKGFSVAAHTKNLEIYYYIHPNVPACLNIDRLRLGQILFNLVGNAVKFTEQGEVAVEIAADKSRIAENEHFTLYIQVRDTGIGIEQKKQREIFKPFHQADNSITRKFGGTGLGLPIVAHLVRLMDGQVTLESQLNKGTRIDISLPALSCSEQALDVKPEHMSLEHQFTKLRILAVDDNPVNLRWLKDMVVSWGSRIDVARSVDDALSILQSAEQDCEYIDILLTDKNMPEKSGFDLVTLIHEKSFKKPSVIIMLSSSEVETDIQTAGALGIEQFLLKPVKQSEVFNAIINALEKRDGLPDKQETRVSGLSITPLNILVAEDNSINQRIIHDILEQRGHHITQVDNGTLAVDLVGKNAFDVILMDVQMPEMDGFEATRKIRQLQTGSPNKSRIIGVSAHALKGDKELGIASGMDDYLTKPLYAEQLIKVVEQSLSIEPARGSSSDTIHPQPGYFDPDNAHRVTANDEALLFRIATMVLNLLPDMMQQIDLSLNEGATEETKERLHKLTGMVANLSNKTLVDELKHFESNLPQEREQALTRWAQLKAKLIHLQAELRTLINED